MQYATTNQGDLRFPVKYVLLSAFREVSQDTKNKRMV